MSVVVKAAGLGKKYLIQHQIQGGRLMFRDVLADLVRRPVRSDQGREETFWALRDVSFEIENGEQVALIGGNGAGKSTLLKLLSRITEPSAGSFTIRGRVSNLLEVGAGFHEELTGRDNIYLSGAICGMSHQEVRRRFDEIVGFAGTEKFLDTPVKRYSSGMRARLAFSIAVNLGSEVLILDEVLAVGDAAFQQAFLEKLKALANQGTTLLFVSHDSTVVRSLCERALLFESGHKVFDGPVSDALSEYARRRMAT